MPNPPTDTSTTQRGGDQVNPLISRQRWEAWRELLQSHGNAFAIGGQVDGRGVLIMAWDFLSRPLTQAEVANLIAWLLLVSEISAAELQPILAAQGVDLADILGPEEPPTCGETGCVAPHLHEGDHTDGIGHWPKVKG